MSLKEIARRCNTSVSTVSRVLNRPDYRCASSELQEKIWQCARQMEYLPNTEARNLKLGTPRQPAKPITVDVFLTRFHSLDADIFFKELYDALQEELLQNGCLIGRLLTLPDVTQHYDTLSPMQAKSKSADGLILLGKCPAELVSFLKGQYQSLVGIDRNPTNFDYDEVICNGTAAASAAMEYLISLGHKKIAYIGDCSYEARYIGYYQALITHRLPLVHANIYPTSQTREEGYQTMEAILKKASLPSAIFCANDSTALGVLAALKKSRQKNYVPSVISIDNIREAETVSPSLTTIDIPKKEMAHHAVKMLLDRVGRGHREHVRVELPCRLIIRESCSS